MVIFRYYDKEKRVDHVWYDSSNVLYSECDDLVDSFKTVRVTFKNGDTYQYKDVDVNDYVMFETGGADASNGKAFYKYIRKYDFVKLDRIPPEKINEMLDEYKKIKAGQILKERTENEVKEEDWHLKVGDECDYYCQLAGGNTLFHAKVTDVFPDGATYYLKEVLPEGSNDVPKDAIFTDNENHERRTTHEYDGVEYEIKIGIADIIRK